MAQTGAMTAHWLVRGLVLGFLVAAPVGPIGLLCIQRTLAQGRRVGFVSGLGAASADAVYGLMAALGLTLVSSFLVRQSVWLGVVGGLFLCYLGVRTLRSKPATLNGETLQQHSLASAYVSTLLFTLTNPMTVLAFVGIFAGAGLASAGGDVWQASALVMGVFLGSAGWWLLLSGGVSLLRRRITHGAMRWVNRIAGLAIVGFGLVALIHPWFG